MKAALHLIGVLLLCGCAAPPGLRAPDGAAAGATSAVVPPSPKIDGVDVSKKNYRTFEGAAGSNFQVGGVVNPKASATADGADRVDGAIDWPALIQMGTRFSYVRITFGDSAVAEPIAQRNWHEAKQAGLHVGPYHYFIASNSKEKIVRQAQHFLAAFDLVEPDRTADFLPLALDLEDKQQELVEKFQLKSAAYRLAICTWLNVVKTSSRFKNREIILYANADFYQSYGLANDQYCGLGRFRLWLANYNVNDSVTYWQRVREVCAPTDQANYGKCIFVQYTDTFATAASPNGKIDRIWFIGEEKDLRSLEGLQGPGT